MHQQSTVKILIGLVSAVFLFHFCVITNIIPHQFVWGGRLQNKNQLIMLEAVSILILLLLGFVLLMKGGIIKKIFSIRLINLILWMYVGLFSLNTIGNLFATTSFEQLFSVLTLLLSLLLIFILKTSGSKRS